MRASIVLATASASLAIIAACAGSEDETPVPIDQPPATIPDAGAPDADIPDVDVPDTRLPDCSSAGWCITPFPDENLDFRDIWPLEDVAFAIAESRTEGVKFLEWKKSTNAWEYIDDLSQNGAGSGTFAGGVYAPNADEVGCRRAARAEGADRLVDGRDRADPRRAASTAERREQRVLRSCAGTTEQVELRARSVRRHRVLERNGEREPRLAQIREADVGQQRRGEPSSKRRTRLSALSLASEPLDVSLCRNDDELVVSKSPQRRPWCHCKNRSGMPSAASNVFRS